MQVPIQMMRTALSPWEPAKLTNDPPIAANNEVTVQTNNDNLCHKPENVHAIAVPNIMPTAYTELLQDAIVAGYHLTPPVIW